MIEAYSGKEILLQKILIEVRKDIIKRYNESCDEFSDTQIATVKRGDNQDILGKRLQENAV
jgi:hypothetical protein